MNKEKTFKAILQWTRLYEDTPLPEDLEEWYDNNKYASYVVSPQTDIVVSYEDEDVQDELDLFDSYASTEHSEDSENSQQLSLDLINQHE